MGEVAMDKKESLLEKAERKEGSNIIEKILKVFKEEKELQGKNLSEFPPAYIEEFYEKGGIADKIAQNIQMNKAQLRKHFAMLKKIKLKIRSLSSDDKLDDETKILLSKLSFLLAYASSRKEAGKPVFDKNLYEFIDFLLKKVRNGTRKDFEIFESLLEAIVAFHAYYEAQKGGR